MYTETEIKVGDPAGAVYRSRGRGTRQEPGQEQATGANTGGHELET